MTKGVTRLQLLGEMTNGFLAMDGETLARVLAAENTSAGTVGQPVTMTGRPEVPSGKDGTSG